VALVLILLVLLAVIGWVAAFCCRSDARYWEKQAEVADDDSEDRDVALIALRLAQLDLVRAQKGKQ
jgi:predicted component of type VI protein secretion system